MNADRGTGPARWRAAAAAAVLLAGAAQAAEDRPSMLWTRTDIAAIRRRIETQEWAKRQYEELPKGNERGAVGLGGLLRRAVLGDEAAGQAEKQILLAATKGGRGQSDYLNPIRFDLLYGDLTAAERDRVERFFRTYVEDAMASMAKRSYNRFNWLPNLAYPWYLTAHLMAASLRDEPLARRIFASKHGLKWYFDEYLSDLGFYNEEFGKMFATPGAMLLWCRACERMGWDDIGYGYVGRRPPGSEEAPATMRGHIESLLRIGLPRVDLGTSRPHYPRVSMGDAMQSRLPAYGFQHDLVPGYLTDGPAGRRDRDWYHGLLPQRIWFEIAHAKWPDAGFGYFLAQMRAPDEDRYFPTLHFGLEPIDPNEVKPPAAPSGVYGGRGLVVLRADESPSYWEGPAPAVGMRLATPYAHHIQDCFALTGFYAFNRAIFLNRKHASNYSGVDPGYSNSARSHCTVVVDFAEPKTIGTCDVRHDFNEYVKFAAARAKGIYDGVDQMRALFLTKEYLLDIFHLESDRPRHYQWIVQALGHVCPDKPQEWTDSRDLVGSLFDLGRERSLETDHAWSVTAVQSSGGANRELSGFGDRWFQRRVGVRTTMMGEVGTTAYHAWSPVVEQANGQWHGKDRFCHGEDEPAAAAIVAVRKKPETTFVALHEPFQGTHRGWRRIYSWRNDKGMLLRIAGTTTHGEEFTDYVAMPLPRYTGKSTAHEIVVGDDDSALLAVSGWAYVRVAAGRADAVGRLEKARIRIGGQRPGLFLAGKAVQARTQGEWLIYRAEKLTTSREDFGPVILCTADILPDPPPVAARWRPATGLALAAGGKGQATLVLRYSGSAPLGGRVRLLGSPGLRISPPATDLKGIPPGGEKELTVRLDAAEAPRNRLLRVLPAAEGPGPPVQPATLRVAHGVCVERSQLWPADFAETIYSPRYVAKYCYMDSTAAALLLDPAGYRRSDASANTYPVLVRRGSDDKGRQRWLAESFPKFPYFISRIVPGAAGGPALAYEAGRHAHGTTGGLEHWFTEDWILCRYRRAGEGERIALDWLPASRQDLSRTLLGRREEIAREKMPGKVLLAGGDGTVHDLGSPDDHRKGVRPPKGVEEIRAVFVRPHGYEHGSAMFYPPGSRAEGGFVTQPADKPMAFTYCTQAQFPPLARKWLSQMPTGQPRQVEIDAYKGAFMPHLEEPRE